MSRPSTGPGGAPVYQRLTVAQLETVADLATQQAAGATDLLPPSASAAAEALAARTVGTLVKIGSDGKPADASVTDAQLATLATGGWLDRFAKLAATYAPGAVECREYQAQNFASNANATAVAMSGGGKTYAKTAGDFIARITDVAILNPKTEPWAVAFDCVTALPQTSKFAWLGLIAADPSVHHISLWNNYDAGSTTQMTLLLYNGNSSTHSLGWTVDTSRHMLMIAFDGTTIRFLVDGVVKAEKTDLLRCPTVPLSAFCYADAGWLQCSRVAYATPY